LSPLERTWAVVVGYNGGEDLPRCLGSLLDQGLAPERIALVDNASRDGSPARARERAPGIVVLQNPENRGFGAAANQGARRALEGGAEAVLFLNDDAWLPPGNLAPLVELLVANPRVGLVGPRIVLPGAPARLWAAGGLRGTGPNLSTLRGHGRLDGPRWQETVAVDYVPGCALVARREVLEVLGGFEESYFAYMEDVELGVRAARAGWLCLCVGSSLCVHAASRSTGGGYNARRKYMNGVNAVRFLRRHGTPADWLRFGLFDVASLPFVGLVGLARGRGRAVLAKGLGIAHGLAGRTVRREVLEPGGTPLW